MQIRKLIDFELMIDSFDQLIANFLWKWKELPIDVLDFLGRAVLYFGINVIDAIQAGSVHDSNDSKLFLP